MKISKIIEKNIEYDTIECIGPLEYIDAKCFVYDNKDNCLILVMDYNINNHNITYHLKRKEYYLNSKLHCVTGPAKITFYNSAVKSAKQFTGVEFWINGNIYPLKKYNIKLRKEKIKKLNSLYPILTIL
jgi:hypothetical protein